MNILTKEQYDALSDDEALFMGVYKGKHKVCEVPDGHYLHRSHACDPDLCLIKFR